MIHRVLLHYSFHQNLPTCFSSPVRFQTLTLLSGTIHLFTGPFQTLLYCHDLVVPSRSFITRVTITKWERCRSYHVYHTAQSTILVGAVLYYITKHVFVQNVTMPSINLELSLRTWYVITFRDHITFTEKVIMKVRGIWNNRLCLIVIYQIST